MPAVAYDIVVEVGAGFSFSAVYFAANGAAAIHWRGAWNAEDTYREGDAVSDGGPSYQASDDVPRGTEPPAAPWGVLTPVDVSGWTAKMEIRDRVGGTVFLTLTEGDGITVGSADGTFGVAITAGAGAALAPIASGVYDLFVTPPAGQPVKLLRGAVTVVPAVTA